VIAGLAAAVLIGAVRDSDESRGATQQRRTTQTTTQTNVTLGAGALNDAGFALMQAGDFAAARPLLERAVRALRSSGSITEAYASYNLAYTRFALGVCSGVLRLLDRSEAIQGERSEINSLYTAAFDRCVRGNSGGGDDDD
jgi:hypothetical protein